jgi:hypothetical protein
MLWMFTAALSAAAGGLAAQQGVDLPARDAPLQAALADAYRVGTIEGAAWQLYGERVEVAFDGAGNLYVFDRDNYRVVAVSPTGTLLREIGKRGDGPGELRSPVDFTVLRDGTVVIADLGQRSFLLFGEDGEFQRAIPFATGSVVTLGSVMADPRGGSVISVGRTVTMVTRGAGAGPGALPTGRPIVRFGLADAAEGREIYSAWTPPAVEAPTQSAGAAGVRFAFGGGARARAFEPQLYASMLPGGGLVVSDSSAYALKVLGPDGAVQRTLRRPVRPAVVTPAMQRAERERQLEQLESGGGPTVSIAVAGRGGAAPQPVPQEEIRAMQRQSIETLEFYPELPVVTGLAAGWTGKIWVARRAPGSDPNAPGPVDVLTAAGEYLGTIAAGGPRIPDAFGPDGLTAYVERDEFEVVRVAVRRLPAELR